MALYNISTTADQEAAIDAQVAVDNAINSIRGLAPMDKPTWIQKWSDQSLAPVLKRYTDSRDTQRLAKLAANPDVLATVDALATPVAKP